MNSWRRISFTKAMHLLDEGRAQDALKIGNDLVASDDEGDRLSGYLCRGLVYEDGGQGLQKDIEKSIYNYRQAALIAPNAISFCYLARASMKKGGESGYSEALKYLQQAAESGVTPEVILGFAHYYRTKPDNDFESAKKFYLRAAFHGRYMGFFGYSEVSRQSGQNFRAAVVDVIRIFLGPFIALLIGVRAQDRF